MGAKYFIPTVNEWYKAAYYDNESMHYTEFATRSNDKPSKQIIDPDPGNNAKIERYLSTSPTVVGEFENSGSFYGTFDQTGNLSEWTQTTRWGTNRIIRDRGYGVGCGKIVGASGENDCRPQNPSFPKYSGFRVAAAVPVPEPGTITLLVCGLAGLLIFWQRQR